MPTNSLSTPSPFNLDAIEHAPLAASTRAKYRRVTLTFLEGGGELGDVAQVQAYAAGLSGSQRVFFKAALRLLSAAYADNLKAGATPENVAQVQAGLYRLEALRDVVKTRKQKGTKAHTWLTPWQVKKVTAACPDTLEGRRDWIILAVLLGAGLRREELETLDFGALKRMPRKGGGFRDALEVKGKGNKTRVIPISALLASRLRAWQSEVGGGRVARSLGRAQRLGEKISAVAIFGIVRKYGAVVGEPELSPHDLRRTFAQLGYDAGVPPMQLSTLLGHESVETTRRYLNLGLDLESTASDFVPLSGD